MNKDSKETNSPLALALAQILWDYHRLNQPISRADAILVLGSHDVRTAEFAAELYLAGWAPYIIMSGGVGHITKAEWKEPEAVIFARAAMEKGVPEKAILLEDKSTNTGENILFTQRLLKEKNLAHEKQIVVHKPYMERRTYATLKKQWPSQDFIVTSPPITFNDYPKDENQRWRVISQMVGDLQKIIEYPKRGFQIEQNVPPEVQRVYEKLIELGYTEHLINR